MAKLNKNLNIIEDSAIQSDKGATVVKEVMTHLEFLFTSSQEQNEKLKKKSDRKKTDKHIDNNNH